MKGTVMFRKEVAWILLIGLILLVGSSTHRTSWLNVNLSLNRPNAGLENVGYYQHHTNSVVISMDTLFRQDVDVLRHELAHAWHYEVVQDEPRGWAWSDCSGDLDCQLREKFDEHRESGELESLAQEEWETTNIGQWTQENMCREGEDDPTPNVFHYAMCNPDEFFAVMSDCYFGKCNYPPWDKEGLKNFDLELYNLIESIWLQDGEIAAAEGLHGYHLPINEEAP